MKSLLKKILFGESVDDRLIEGRYAHDYQNEDVRQQIIEEYTKTHTVEDNPFTNPLKYDPLNPPNGWAYDPFYEFWIRFK